MDPMNIAPFETEHFFARYEFSTPYQLCNSDCESMPIAELLERAGVTMDSLGSERLGYTESQGQLPLREAIATTYSRVSADDVVVLGTPVEGIYLAARALLQPGDEVVVLTPAYDALINLFEHIAGPACVHRWAIRAEGGGWGLDLDELRRLLSPKTRLVVVNFPHNPTGFLPPASFQQELMDVLREHGAWLFCDEMYFGLVNPGTDAIPSATDLTERCVVLSGLSKTHGLPGLRAGWLVVRDGELRSNIMNWKFYTSICPPVPTEFLALAALRIGEELRQRSLATITANLEIAEAFFARWPERFTWRRPQAGSTALVGFNVPSVKRLSHRLAGEEGILIQSGLMLGSDDRHMRIGLGRADWSIALDRFEAWLRKSFPGG